VWPRPPKADGGPHQATPRPASRTTSLPFQQAKGLINALAFAVATLPADTPWAHVTMVLGQSDHDVSAPRQYLALQSRILRAVQCWLRAKGLPAHCLWVREIGPRYGPHHTHLLLPLPPHLYADLAELIRRVGKLRDTSNNRAVEITPKRNRWTKGPTKGLITRAQHAGVLRDWLKTMSPRGRLNGIRIMPALDTDNRGQQPCTILGKRSGTSESLSRAARKRAGWRELETLAELRAVLPTREEARKQRRQEQQRRRRAAKKAGIVPTRWPPTRRQKAVPEAADPFDVSDLAADFFEDA
jgi:hypothetical protein